MRADLYVDRSTENNKYVDTELACQYYITDQKQIWDISYWQTDDNIYIGMGYKDYGTAA